MRMFVNDMRHALVAMRRERQFAATALVTLALGIGVTGAVFSIVYGVLLRPLPYPDSNRLVRVYDEHPGAPRMPGEPPLTNTTMYAWRARLTTLEGLAAYYAREYTVVFEGEGVRMHGAEASASLFPILRTIPSPAASSHEARNRADAISSSWSAIACGGIVSRGEQTRLVDRC